MSDYIKSNIGSGYNSATNINTELGKIETAIASKVDEEGGVMTGDLQMNSNDVLNAGQISTNTLILDGVALTANNPVNSDTTVSTTRIVATAGQTVFTVPSYSLGINAIQVFLNGVKLSVATDYAETNATTITLTDGASEDDVFEALIGSTVTDANNYDSALVTYDQGGTGSVATNVKAKLQETVSVKDFGAVGDGVTNDNSSLNTALSSNTPVHIPDGSYVFTGINLSETETIASCDGTLVGDELHVRNVSKYKLSDIKIVGDDDGGFTVHARGDSEFIRFYENDVVTDGFGIVLKPSLDTPNDTTEYSSVCFNLVQGNTVNARVGISIDGDTSYTTVLGNHVHNIQRDSQPSNEAHGYALAGGIGADSPVFESRACFFAFNTASDIRENGFHNEDINPQSSFLFNISHDVMRGVEVGNDSTPFMQNYIGNAVHQHTEQGIKIAGTGDSDSLNVSYNLIDGADATQTEDGILVQAVATKNVSVDHNIVANQDVDGLEIQSGGASSVSYNVFKNITGSAIVGRSSTGGVGTGTLIESNNKFDSVGAIIDTANAETLIGDKEVISDEIDGNVSSSQVLFVAQRPGIITTLTRIATSVGGGGSTNGTFSVGVSGDASIESARSIPRTQSLYDVTTFKPAALDGYTFNKGDIITLTCDGAGDASSLAKIQLEYFYYN